MPNAEITLTHCSTSLLAYPFFITSFYIRPGFLSIFVRVLIILNNTLHHRIFSLTLTAAAAAAAASAAAAATAAAAPPSPVNINNGGAANNAANVPQMVLTSGQVTQGVQGAQLLVPTSQGTSPYTHGWTMPQIFLA